MRALLLGLGLCAASFGAAQLPANPALDAKADYTFRFTPLPDVFLQLRKETGLELRPDPRIFNRRLTAFVSSQPRREFLSRMALVLGCEWVTEDGTIRLRPKAEIEKAERESHTLPLAKAREEIYGDIKGLIREANRPLADLLAEFQQALQTEKTLKDQRPDGWETKLTALTDRLDRVLRPFALRPALRDVLLTTKNWPQSTWYDVIGGKRVSLWSPDNGPSGGRYVSFIGQPMTNTVEMWQGQSRAKIAGTDACGGSTSARYLPPQDKAITAKSFDSQYREQPRPWINFDHPGDLDVMETLHKEYGLNTVMEGLRTTRLMGGAGYANMPSIQSLIERSTSDSGDEIRFDKEWIMFHPADTLEERMMDPDSAQFSHFEKNGANDVPALVRFLTPLPGPFLGRIGAIRTEASLQMLTSRMDLWDFLSTFSMAQLIAATKGNAISFRDLTPIAKQQFAAFLMEDFQFPEGRPAWVQGLVDTPLQWNDTYFYFERVARPMWRVSNADGKTVVGGINDNIDKLFPNDMKVTRSNFYQYELNFYFGFEFSRSVRHQLILNTPTAPPEPAPESNPKPPEHHEGQGPG